MLLSVALVLVYRYIDRIPILLGTFWSCPLRCGQGLRSVRRLLCELLLVTFQGWPRCFSPRDSGIIQRFHKRSPPPSSLQPAVLSTWDKVDSTRAERGDLLLICFAKLFLAFMARSCCFVGMFCASLKGGGGVLLRETGSIFFCHYFFLSFVITEKTKPFWFSERK